MYQLWLDDLYPRAKFADALAIIEKLGHTKRMQVMRKAWIDEGKPKDAGYDDMDMNIDEDRLESDKTSKDAAAATDTQAEEDNYDDLFMRGPSAEPGQSDKNGKENEASLFISDDEQADEPPMDDLDLLLAEDAQEAAAPIRNPVAAQGDFDDEMEAMAGLEEFW